MRLDAVHPGVYLTHTGTPTWNERCWPATLYAGRSALHLTTALHQTGRLPPPAGPVHVAVDWTRRIAPQPGIRVHRVRELADKVQWNLSPPRVRLEVAAVEVAHRAADDLAAISALAALVGSRRSVAGRPHSLPEPTSQQLAVAGATSTEYRDVAHADLDLSVELDGQLHDEVEARDADADRDLDDLALGNVTPRVALSAGLHHAVPYGLPPGCRLP